MILKVKMAATSRFQPYPTISTGNKLQSSVYLNNTKKRSSRQRRRGLFYELIRSRQGPCHVTVSDEWPTPSNRPPSEVTERMVKTSNPTSREVNLNRQVCRYGQTNSQTIKEFKMELKTDSVSSLEKNPISSFMEYGQARKLQSSLDVIGRSGPDNAPVFTIAAYLGDREICTVQSKRIKDGKAQAADKAMRMLRAENQVRPMLRIQASTPDEDISPVPGDPVSALMEYTQATGKTARFDKLDTYGLSHLPTFSMVAIVDDHMYEVVTGSNLKQTKKKAAIKALIEIDKKQDISAGLTEYHRHGFTYCACLNGEAFPRAVASTKKDAKTDAALNALRDLRDKGLFSVDDPSANLPGNSTALCKTFEDKMAALCHDKFTQLVADVSEDLRGRKVIAAIVMMDRDNRLIQVVSMGSGNRFINGDKMSMHGNVLNDSHAEIIAKRGFRRYLYHSIQACIDGSHDTVLQKSSRDRKLKIKDGVTFHLYISTAPCGDSAIFTHSETAANLGASDKTHMPISDNAKQGQLRTKMEKSEGTIPVGLDDEIQSWDGIQRGERLRTMSCSDKICSWNVLGIQGALLSNLMAPVYLDTITLGQLFSHGHLCRAVCCRVDKESGHFSDYLPAGFRVNHPTLGQVTAYAVPRNTEKSRAYSTNWNSCDNVIEVTDGTTGRCVQSESGGESVSAVIRMLRQSMVTSDGNVRCGDRESSSRLSKANLYKSYIDICKKIGLHDLIGDNYREAKQKSADYQSAKRMLKERLHETGCGSWLSKPIESELFSSPEVIDEPLEFRYT